MSTRCLGTETPSFPGRGLGRGGLGSSHVHFVTVNSGHVMRHPETVEAIHRVILGASNET